MKYLLIIMMTVILSMLLYNYLVFSSKSNRNYNSTEFYVYNIEQKENQCLYWIKQRTENNPSGFFAITVVDSCGKFDVNQRLKLVDINKEY